MKPKEYAEKIVEKYWRIITSKPVEEIEINVWSIDYAKTILASIEHIEGQIEAMNWISDDNPTMPRFTPYIEQLQKSIDYLKSKL